LTTECWSRRNVSNGVSALHFNALGSGKAAASIRVRDICLAAAIIFCLMAPSANADPRAEQVPPRSVLILDQSTSLRPWPAGIIAGIRSVLDSSAGPPMALYVEHLDLHRFNGSEYQDSLRQHFSEKYRDRPIGVIATIGPRAFEYAMRLRETLW